MELTAIFLTLFIITMILALHEAAHAVMLMKYGVEIAEAGIGLPLHPKFKLKLKFMKFPIVFSIWFIGAYVKPSERGEQQLANELPFEKRLHIYGAGVLTNIFIGFALLFLFVVLHNGFFNLVAILTGVIAVAVFLFRKKFSKFAVPVLGVAVVGSLLFSIGFLLFSLFQGEKITSQMTGVAGPIGIVQDVVNLFFGSGYSFESIILSAATMSIIVGLSNMLPFKPFDGGRIVAEIVNRHGINKWSKRFDRVSKIVVIGLFAYIALSDVLRFVR